MNGMFENGPIPPEALGGGDAADWETSWLKTWAAKCILDDRPMPADGFREQDTWGPGFVLRLGDGPIAIAGAVDEAAGGRFSPDDLEAKAQAFREDMIERVTRKGPEGEA